MGGAEIDIDCDGGEDAADSENRGVVADPGVVVVGSADDEGDGDGEEDNDRHNCVVAVVENYAVSFPKMSPRDRPVVAAVFSPFASRMPRLPRTRMV